MNQWFIIWSHQCSSLYSYAQQFDDSFAQMLVRACTGERQSMSMLGASLGRPSVLDSQPRPAPEPHHRAMLGHADVAIQPRTFLRHKHLRVLSEKRYCQCQASCSRADNFVAQTLQATDFMMRCPSRGVGRHT